GKLRAAWQLPTYQITRLPNLLSVPLQISDLVKIHVSAAEHSHDLRSCRGFDQPMEQSRHRRCRGAFHHQFAVRHDPDHGLEDVAVRKRCDLVHKTLHHGKRVIAHTFYAQAVNDAIDLIQRNHTPGLDALLHGRTIGRFHADDLDLRI